MGWSTSERGSGCTNLKELPKERSLFFSLNKNCVYLRALFLIHAKALWAGRGLGLGRVLCSPLEKGTAEGQWEGLLELKATSRGFAWTSVGGELPARPFSAPAGRQVPVPSPPPQAQLLWGVWPSAPKFHISGQLCLTNTPHLGSSQLLLPSNWP